MLIRVVDIPQAGRRIVEEVDATWVDRALGDAGRGVVGAKGAFEARVDRVGDAHQVLVRGRAAVPVVLRCARCAEDFEADVSFEVTHVLTPRPEGDAAGEAPEGDGDEDGLELSDEDMDVSYIDGPEFDLEDVVREHLLLAIPMNPLCRDECAGLCDQCGADLNRGACGCGAAVDPRWSGLAKIKLN